MWPRIRCREPKHSPMNFPAITGYTLRRCLPVARRSLVLVGFFLLTSCQAQSPVSPSATQLSTPQSAIEAEARLVARIRTAAADNRCAAQADCRTLPLGERSCGGPEAWLAFSTQTARGDRLQALASQLASAQRRRNESTGAQSTCQYLADPGAACVAQRCVLRTREGAE